MLKNYLEEIKLIQEKIIMLNRLNTELRIIANELENIRILKEAEKIINQ